MMISIRGNYFHEQCRFFTPFVTNKFCLRARKDEGHHTGSSKLVIGQLALTTYIPAGRLAMFIRISKQTRSLSLLRSVCAGFLAIKRTKKEFPPGLSCTSTS